MATRTVTLRMAKAKLSELSERAAAGEDVVITKHGRPVARLCSARQPRKQVDPGRLRALTRRQPRQPESAGRWLRGVRDRARY